MRRSSEIIPAPLGIAETSPIASAPWATAVRASATDLMQQILMRGRCDMVGEGECGVGRHQQKKESGGGQAKGYSGHMLSKPLGFRKTLACVAALFAAVQLSLAAEATTTVWKLDDIKRVGGHATEVLGAPRVVDGAAVFDGAHDGIFVPTDPLEGAKEFTIEILFSPAEGGPEAQRFFHLQDTTDAQWRVMIETRLDGKGHWWLDSYLGSPKGGTALIDEKRVHPTNMFYWAAVRYDGKTMTHFVNGELELTGAATFGPLGPGKLSLGVRQNKVYWFKGAIREVRFTPVALTAEKLQRVK
jgi:hypothetical protein